MIRDWFARAAEVRDLRDRAVTDAQRLANLGDQITGVIVERDVARTELARRTAECDQATARVEDLASQIDVWVSIARQLGVTCIHPIPGGVIVHVTPTKEIP